MPSQQEIIGSHNLIIETFKGFRSELMRAYGKIDHYTKGDTSPVTLLDVKIETVLKDKLQQQFPDFGFKGEETDEVLSKNGATWFVDPIDGTASFIHGLPYCSNMAGLVVNDEIVASVIYHFAADELYTALKNEGAYKNGDRIFVKNTDLNNSFVFANSYAYKKVYKFFQPSGVKFYAPMGASGYFFTRIAQGSIQGACYLKANIKMHDTIPGALLVLEAGGEITSFNGSPFGYKCLDFLAGTHNICDLTKQNLKEIVALNG